MATTTKNALTLAIPYRHDKHRAMPHVVKFSGGRSSAALLFGLAEGGALRPERGDVALFANTSAEHPATYEFAAECTRRIEADYGIPCLWYEFCTVEDASRGVYARQLAYRLVRPVPVEDDPDGYRSHGEVFEEMLSFQGMLPNPHSRSCTAKLKLYPAHQLLEEWLAASDGPAHAGHYAEQRFVEPESAAARYVRNGGTASADDFSRRVTMMTEQPSSRPAQRWQDFTTVPLAHRPVGQPPRISLWDADRAERGEFVTLLGLRADEPNRVKRVLSRTLLAEDAGGPKCTIKTQPPGEHPYFPLYDNSVTGEDVAAFWDGHEIPYAVPDGAGNCVYCFMKGTKDLAAQAAAQNGNAVPGAPSDIRWWVDIEQRYRREAPARNGDGISRFGFFGVHGPTFEDVACGNIQKSRYSTGTPACDCTD